MGGHCGWGVPGTCARTGQMTAMAAAMPIKIRFIPATQRLPARPADPVNVTEASFEASSSSNRGDYSVRRRPSPGWISIAGAKEHIGPGFRVPTASAGDFERAAEHPRDASEMAVRPPARAASGGGGVAFAIDQLSYPLDQDVDARTSRLRT